MRPVSNQPDRFFATAKTHKFTSLNDITLENLKLRPITFNRDMHLQHFKSYSKLFAVTFKESIHHLRHLKVSGLTKKCRPQC